MPPICLNMIVKDEAARIVRCLASVMDYIDSYVIVDTGSTDGTPDIIRDMMRANGKKGEIHHVPFENFEQARNAALRLARGSSYKAAYHLLVDADMELVVENASAFDNLVKPAYDILQKAGGLAYRNKRLVRYDQKGEYIGVTHEFLNVPGEDTLSGVWFRDYADGANRTDKFKRDINLILDALEKESSNERYWFYLAQSYRDDGQHEKAAQAYKKRVALGGWDEEVWNAQVNYAHCLETLGDEAGFIRELLIAYNMRPQRIEVLYDLAKHYRIKGMNAPAALFAEAGLEAPYSKDALFVSDYVYTVGMKEEYSIAAFYDKDKRARGFEVCDALSLEKQPYTGARDLARSNLFHYIRPLSDMVPSFTPNELPFSAPVLYSAMNPSVCVHGGQIYCVARTVNYTITEDGRYEIRGTDGSITPDNPIHTRNFLLRLSSTFEVEVAKEIFSGQIDPPQYNLVVGFEDMRLFSYNGALWTSSCVREMNPEGYCEQVLARLSEEGHDVQLRDLKKMLPEKREHEKNWMPIVGREPLQFVYRPGQTVGVDGKFIRDVAMKKDVGHLSGGSQVIPFEQGWLAVVHEARIRPDNGKRYYQHRFVYFDEREDDPMISRPFVFHDKVIEFAAGLALHPNGTHLILSYGREDKEAWLATMRMDEVWNAFD